MGHDDLRRDVLGRPGHGDAGVLQQLRADNYRCVLLLFGKVDADAAARAYAAHALEGVDIVGRQTQKLS